MSPVSCPNLSLQIANEAAKINIQPAAIQSGKKDRDVLCNCYSRPPLCVCISIGTQYCPQIWRVFPHWIIFQYLWVRVKKLGTFFIISPTVLKFCKKSPTHIWEKIGGEQNWSKKIKIFLILNFVQKIVKIGKFWPKNRIPAFLAHKWW